MNDKTEKLLAHYSNYLVHYYRAEVNRETVWRSRLDITTNWAIVITAGLLTFVFGNPESSHVVLVINYFIIWFFTYIEARRFRYYAVVKDRVKIFEKHILGPLMGMKDDADTDEWLEELSLKITKPRIKMSRLEALSWRLRKNYVFILFTVYAMWFYKVSVNPVPVNNAYDFFRNATVAFVPGIFVASVLTGTLLIAVILVFLVNRKWSGNDLP